MWQERFALIHAFPRFNSGNLNMCDVISTDTARSESQECTGSTQCAQINQSGTVGGGGQCCGGFCFMNCDMFTTPSVLKQWCIITIIWSRTTYVAPLYCFVVNLITHP